MKYIIAFIVCTITFTYASDIYQYTDNNGRTVYTNKPIKGAKKVDLPPLSIYAAPMTKADLGAKNYTEYGNTTGKLKISKLSSNEQGRHNILQDELTRETQALKDANQALDEGKRMHLGTESKNLEAYNSRTQALQDAVTEHQKNINILTRQLSE